MNDKKVEQVVLEFVEDQPMVSRCGNLPVVMHASFTVSGCVHVCFLDFDCKSMSTINNQNSSSCLRDALMKF